VAQKQKQMNFAKMH